MTMLNNKKGFSQKGGLFTEFTNKNIGVINVNKRKNIEKLLKEKNSNVRKILLGKDNEIKSRNRSIKRRRRKISRIITM